MYASETGVTADRSCISTGLCCVAAEVESDEDMEAVRRGKDIDFVVWLCDAETGQEDESESGGFLKNVGVSCKATLIVGLCKYLLFASV
jgi:hypothetical protein